MKLQVQINPNFTRLNFTIFYERLSVCVCVVREKAMQKNIEKKTERETTTVTMQ